MTVTLNNKAVTPAKHLVEDGRSVHDERDDWSEHAPSTDDENRFIDENGFADYGKWYLGVDDEIPDDTKGHYSFPYGDFTKVHRCAVISGESWAAQYDHTNIEDALRGLLDQLDKK